MTKIRMLVSRGAARQKGETYTVEAGEAKNRASMAECVILGAKETALAAKAPERAVTKKAARKKAK